MSTAAIEASVAQVQARVASIEARLRPGATGSSSSASGVSFSAALSKLSPRSGGASSVSGVQLRSLAQQYVGIPYVWGGTDPATGLDCSGFTQDLFGQLGVELPRVSADQLRCGSPVADLASARPGDLLGWDTGPRNVGADHVAVYLGDGLMAEAPGTGGRVQIVPVDRPPDVIRRVLPTAAGVAPIRATGSAGGLGAATPYAALFEAAGARHDVDPQLLALVAQRESGFDPKAVSGAGAQGLMQLMPTTARSLGVTNPFDPQQAVDGAARLLRQHLDAFGSVDQAVAAYNAGPGNVRKYGGVPPFAETQRYVQWIGERYSGSGAWS